FALAARSTENVHQDFNCGGFSGPVVADERVEGALGDLQREAIYRVNSVESLGQAGGMDGWVHRRVRPPCESLSLGLRRLQWSARDSTTSSISIPRRLASTTRASISCSRSRAFSLRLTSGRGA